MKRINFIVIGLIAVFNSSCEKANEKDKNSVTDYDGNTYKSVAIGTQTWMAENLRVTHYPNGNAIPLITDSTAWSNLEDNDSDDAYCYYNNNSNSEYGALYTYAAAKNVCPTGWHLPGNEEWETLINYISSDGHYENEGAALKATSGWYKDGNGTDDYGFAALPGGTRTNLDGSFYNVGYVCAWWAAFEDNGEWALDRALSYSCSTIDGGVYGINKSLGLSVRCVKD